LVASCGGLPRGPYPSRLNFLLSTTNNAVGLYFTPFAPTLKSSWDSSTKNIYAEYKGIILSIEIWYRHAADRSRPIQGGVSLENVHFD
jgi:hypothetical protein